VTLPKERPFLPPAAAFPTPFPRRGVARRPSGLAYLSTFLPFPP